MRSALLDLVLYDAWATLRLIDFVRGLSAEQRTWDAPGTYGSIEQTLGHIVGAEQYYVFRLTGEIPATELKESATVDLDDLAARVNWCAKRLQRLCADGFDSDAATHVNPRDPRVPTMGGMLTQLLYHAGEHRAQVGTALGVHGVVAPI